MKTDNKNRKFIATNPVLMAGQAGCLTEEERKIKIADLEKAVTKYMKWIFNINPQK